MGQTLSSETLSISGGDGCRYWVGLTMKPSEVGCKKTVYKGVLLGHGPRQWEKVVAKAFTDIPGTKESWKYELIKADVTKQLAAKFTQEYPSLYAIRIVVPGIVQMDRVSNINKWLADKDDGRGLTKDEWISVEELIPGEMGRFCPWSTKHKEGHVESKHMQAFSHFTYKNTNGELVACDFQGIYDHKSSKYIFTDSSIHSIHKMYGLFDQGECGISEFFKLHTCNEICNGWPRPTPLTPPPSFEEAFMLQINLTPTSAYENIVFPAHSSGAVAQGGDATNRDAGERRRHRSEHHQQLRRQVEVSWMGHSTDLHDYQRQLNGSTEREALSPPHYENLSASTTINNSQPPPYDSLISPGRSSSNHIWDLNSRSPLQYRGQSRSLKKLKSSRDSSAVRDVQFRQRSATDPVLHQENAVECHYSDACSASYILNSQLQNLPCSNDSRSNPIFYCDEALPSLVMPSAPPEEDDDISGT